MSHCNTKSDARFHVAFRLVEMKMYFALKETVQCVDLIRNIFLTILWLLMEKKLLNQFCYF